MNLMFPWCLIDWWADSSGSIDSQSNAVQSLRWRHNERDGVSNHQPHDCLLNRLFKAHIKEASKPRNTAFCVGNSPVTGEFPAQRASNAENVSIRWRHHHHVCNLPNDSNTCRICQTLNLRHIQCVVPDNKVHGSNMGPIWVLSAPHGLPWTLFSGIVCHWVLYYFSDTTLSQDFKPMGAQLS